VGPHAEPFTNLFAALSAAQQDRPGRSVSTKPFTNLFAALSAAQQDRPGRSVSTKPFTNLFAALSAGRVLSARTGHARASACEPEGLSGLKLGRVL
jgi:hypothetical protein